MSSAIASTVVLWKPATPMRLLNTCLSHIQVKLRMG